MNNPFEVIDARLSSIENLLLNLTNASPIQAPPDPKKLFTVDEMSARLRVRRQTIYNRLSAGKISHTKVGGRVYFSEQDIQDYINSGKRLTADQITANVDTFLRKKRKAA